MHAVGMPVSTARIREIRKQLDDAARDLEGSEEYAELADIVGQAADAFDETVDERGQPSGAPPVQVGARVKREPADEPPDDADMKDMAPEPDDPDAPPAKRKLPPQFAKRSSR